MTGLHDFGAAGGVVGLLRNRFHEGIAIEEIIVEHELVDRLSSSKNHEEAYGELAGGT